MDSLEFEFGASMPSARVQRTLQGFNFMQTVSEVSPKRQKRIEFAVA
jgi:hypothetical protein